MTQLEEPTVVKRALLDTSVQVDRMKSGTRSRRIDEILEKFELHVSTGIALLEFKATIIQQCISIHNQLRLRQRFTVVRDSMIEKMHPQTSLRSHIFNNLINVFCESSFDISAEDDRLIAEKARLALERIIPRLYKWFLEKSTDKVLTEKIQCTRALEPPAKKRVAFTENLPLCRRGHNKFCSIEEFIRQQTPPLIPLLRELGGESEQIQKACDLFEAVCADPKADLSHSDCRRAGDCLIALEARDTATHAISTNQKEWAPLSRALGFGFVHVAYPEERTR